MVLASTLTGTQQHQNTSDVGVIRLADVLSEAQAVHSKIIDITTAAGALEDRVTALEIKEDSLPPVEDFNTFSFSFFGRLFVFKWKFIPTGV